jgi:hypothetical protein
MTFDDNKLVTDAMPATSMQTPGALSTPGRAVNTAYQPNTERPTLLSVVLGARSSSTKGSKSIALEVAATIGTLSSNQAARVLADIPTATNAVVESGVSVIVPAGWYYRLSTNDGDGFFHSLREHPL